MSLVRMPDVRSYWSLTLGFDKIKETMSYNKFAKIRRFLHFNKNSEMRPRDHPDHDRLYKLRPVITKLNNKFQSVPLQETLYVDEQLSSTKGRHYMKQYLPAKPHKWGCKLYVICGTDGFGYNFEIFTGDENNPKFRKREEPDLGSIANVVIRLCRSVPKNQNFMVYFDNYCSSIPLAVYFANCGILSLGTIRRIRIPNCKLPPEKEMMKEKRGSSTEFVADIEGVEISTVAWKGNTVVTLIFSFTCELPLSQVKRFDKKENKPVHIPCPNLAKEYNRHMGGVDLLDGLIGRYKIIMQTKKCIHSACYSPDGNQLIVAAGDKVLVYDPSDGGLLETLKAHKDIVHCTAYARDGKKFASGSADKSVIIWTNKLEGLLKYSHGDAIQCMSFNPISHQLASCSSSDFALWSAEQKAVQKYKISFKVNACGWTNDGQYLLLGLSNGSISIRNKAGEEKGKVERPGGPNNPIFGVQCCPTNSSNTDVLCVVDWGQTMAFYTLGGQLVGKERFLGFDPLCLSYFQSGEFLIVAGCNKSVQLFTKEGIKLGTLGEIFDSWVWTVAIHPDGLTFTVGCQDGTLASYNIVSSTVHALYRERYAFRENMCDVIIQHLISGQKVRIKCRDLVHKIAIYRNRLAVQLPERVVLYELSSPENQPMHYKVKEKITKKFECSLLVVCAQHIVLCQEKKLQSLNFNGALQREWIMDSLIRYIKVTGGPIGKEGLLLGLKNGQVWRIFLDNALPILITTVMSSVRCLDLNATRNKLAVVDDAGRLVVRDLLNDSMLYQDSGVNSVAWNTHLESMLCYSHITGGLSVRVGNLPPRSPQSMIGVVVGLCGSTAFCLRGNVMHNVPLALGATMWQFIEAGFFEEAYQVACLGVPNNDWQGLAQAALEALQLNIARNAFVKVRNLTWLQLISELQEKQKRGDVPKEVLQADSMAYAGKFKEAARLYQKCSHGNRALSMYSDLRMFDLAQEFLKDEDVADKRELVRRRAEWACSVHEPRAAAELLLSAGENERAIEIVAEQGWSDVLFDIGRRLSQTEKIALEQVAIHLKRLKALPLAAEIYKKLGEDSQVVQLHIEARDWVEAFRLAENVPELLAVVHYQHAQWLAESDKFIEAHQSYIKAGRIKDAEKLLKDLSECAINEQRFFDASYFVWLMAKQFYDFPKEGESLTDHQKQEFIKLQKLSKIYFAYNMVHSYLKEPFTSNPPLTLFNASRFILNEIQNKRPPKGVSLFAVLYTLSKQAKALDANKLYLQINKRLQSLKPPPNIQEQIDINYLNSKACRQGFNDPEELLPLCYKCSNYSTQLSGNSCPTCQQEYTFSFVSFEILPLVEFHPEIDINDAEAERILLAPPKANDDQSDPFAEILNEEMTSTLPLTLDRSSLRSIDPSHVLIVKHKNSNFKNIYYRNLLPDLQITFCPDCRLTFYAEDFELQVLQKGHCPYCRTPSEKLFECCERL